MTVGNQVLAERYARLCQEPSDIFEHLPVFVEAVKKLNATRVIELGVSNATTPQPPFPVKVAMEEFCEKRGLRFHNNPRNSGLGTIFV